MKKPDSLRRYRANLQGEVDGAVVYRALAESESDPKLAEVFRRLTSGEEAHGEFWRGRMGAKGDKLLLGPSLRARILAWLAHRFGPGLVIPTLAAAESRDSAVYDDQADASSAGLPDDERSHARIMRAVAGQCGLAGPTLAMLEGRHRGGGNTLRAAVLGANDGLVSNLSLVMGVAGAAAAERTLLLTGLAGLVAGACSMAMGEWLSVTSSRNRQNEAQREKAKKAPIPAKGTAIRAQRVTPPEGNCRKGREKLHTTGSGERSVRVVGCGSSPTRTLLCRKFPANREFYRDVASQCDPAGSE